MSRYGISMARAQSQWDHADDGYPRVGICPRCRRKSSEGERINGECVCLDCAETGDTGSDFEPEVAFSVNVRGEW